MSGFCFNKLGHKYQQDFELKEVPLTRKKSA